LHLRAGLDSRRSQALAENAGSREARSPSAAYTLMVFAFAS